MRHAIRIESWRRLPLVTLGSALARDQRPDPDGRSQSAEEELPITFVENRR